jgi:ADP-dependent NAD(P)H-hydrate dehydratase / NAD(P)H-hydrate epimerase
MIKQNFDPNTIVVTAEEMRHIEERIFQSGMPVAALMEKAANLIFQKIINLFPISNYPKIGVIVGPGHNGGDALVIARELWLQGYEVKIYQPINKLKELTSYHSQYANFLGINFIDQISDFRDCSLIIDGLFGFGLERNIEGKLAEIISYINQSKLPVVSIDIPSGIHTDTGEVLGIAIKANYTFCLGLWKLAFFQDSALEYLGKVERLDFGIPDQAIENILGKSPSIRRMTAKIAKKNLPLPRPLVTHKYQQGHLLLICGSSRYAGGAILTGLGARGSGVGMLSIAVPQSLKPLLVSQLPEALIIGCEETETGAIASLPLDLTKFSTVACGPGLTTDAHNIIQQVLEVNCPLILDADGLNILAELDNIGQLKKRSHATVLTPHWGEFKRLFPDLVNLKLNKINLVQKAAQKSGAMILLKGARTAIASPVGSVWFISDSTPALARGGSGDLLTGLLGGLIAQKLPSEITLETVATAAWWHAQAAILAAKECSELGVDGVTLAQYFSSVIKNLDRC